MINILRVLVFGVQNFWRNIWLSLITVLIVLLNLCLMSTVMGLNIVGQQTLQAVKQKVSLSVYFTASTTETRAQEIRSELLKNSGVQSIRVISRDEHLQNLIKSQSDPKLVEDAIKQLGDNPLGPGLVINAKNLDDYAGIAKAIKDPKYKNVVESTGNDYESNQQIISKLSGIVHRVQVTTWWVTAVLGLIMLLMVFNTIRVTIYSQREEIGIMKLVGASDAFVRGPFIVTSFLYGFLASVIVLALMIPILSVFNPFFAQFFAGYDINVLGYVQSHIWQVIGVEIGVASGLSVVSSFFAIGRYLRV
jgi:cell division transport system permease protein